VPRDDVGEIEPPARLRAVGRQSEVQVDSERAGGPLPLQDRVRHLGKEPRGRVAARLPEHGADTGMSEHQLIFCPRHAHITQATLLGQLLLVDHRPLVRKHVLLETRDEHSAELQALGGVKRHQCHRVA